MNNDIALLIPAYNEAHTIRDVISEVLTYSNQVIVVDDGSTDGTADAIRDLPITLLINAENQGKAQSLKYGFNQAIKENKTAVITLDADRQHNPADIPKFIQAWEKYPNALIIGARLINNKQAPKHRLYANKLADFFISLAAGCRVIDSQSGYRLYPKALLTTCLPSLDTKSKFAFESEIIIEAARQNHPCQHVSIASHYPSNARSSHYQPISDSWRIIKMIASKLFKSA
ncbi:MAG: glycosyltransferase family 2 protein [Gammaproteobacteria bacterium]|nr:glycosyltransferase family 2 protein [Gammaproteobacteria bacterium]